MDEALFNDEALRMIKAFFNIHDHHARKLLICLAESAERGQSIEGIVDGSLFKSDERGSNVIDLQPSKNRSK